MQAGDTAAAAELALASARAAEWVGAAIEAARSRLVAGQALAAGDDRGAALATLRSAADELEATGALRFHAEARRELRRLGVRPAAPTPRGRASCAGSTRSRRASARSPSW